MLRVSEIFYSIQGETKTVGIPTVFVRLTGCPLRCQYCDTAYAFHGGKLYAMDAIMAEIKKYETHYVTVTGGEPLAQKSCIHLLQELCNQDYQVSLETSGALSLAQVDSRVSKVMDIKTPGSNEVDKNNWENIEYLSNHDQIKFVICHQTDYVWAKQIIKQYNLTQLCHVFMSPSYQQMKPSELADWILQDQLAVRLQIQLHKHLWGDLPGK